MRRRGLIISAGVTVFLAAALFSCFNNGQLPSSVKVVGLSPAQAQAVYSIAQQWQRENWLHDLRQGEFECAWGNFRLAFYSEIVAIRKVEGEEDTAMVTFKRSFPGQTPYTEDGLKTTDPDLWAGKGQ